MIQEKTICKKENKICFTKKECEWIIKHSKKAKQYNKVVRCYPCPHSIRGSQHWHLTSKIHDKKLNIEIHEELWSKFFNFE